MVCKGPGSLESPGILLWHFAGLKIIGKKATGRGKFWKSVKKVNVNLRALEKSI